jgi:hypothetical protein
VQLVERRIRIRLDDSHNRVRLDSRRRWRKEMKGHLRERSPGHWAIVIDAQDAAEKRKRRWHSFRGTKRQAQVQCAKLIAEQQTGAAIDPSRITLAEFIARFDRDWIAVNVTPRSRERYQYALKHALRHLGPRALQKLRPVDLAAFYAALLQGGLASNTIKLVHRVLHKALGQAEAWGVIRSNPAELAKPPKVLDSETQMLQPDQAAALLERLRLHGSPPLYMLASLALATGARRNELLALRWCDIDMDAARLTIERALEQTIAHGIRVKAPKTQHGRRVITLQGTLWQSCGSIGVLSRRGGLRRDLGRHRMTVLYSPVRSMVGT